MKYSEAVDYIHSLLKFGIKPGFERIGALLELMDNPQDKLKYVHVAGTNGKGSLCNITASALSLSGYKTGLFTSPYVVDFCERIQINNEMIPHGTLSREVEKVIPLVEQLRERGLEPTEFEVITAIAFNYFYNEKCDIVVLEVGLGGSLDSTNVIKESVISAVMSVSLDHMDILGDTLGQIASQKAGIIKSGGTTILYPIQSEITFSVIKEKCKLMKNRLVIPSLEKVKVIGKSIYGTDFVIGDDEYHCAMLGEHQLANAVSAIELLTLLNEKGFVVTKSTIKQALAQCRIPARMEILCEKPLVLLDGGHNEGCAMALNDALVEFLPNNKILAVIGLMRDKEYDKYLKIVGRNFNSVICTTVDNPRTLSGNQLKKVAANYCHATYSASNVKEAVALAFQMMESFDALVVCGSFYLAADARKEIINSIKSK